MNSVGLISRSSAGRRLAVVLAGVILLPGCKALREKYFNTLEKVGIERRELLVSRVDKAREAQVDAEKQFKDALEQLQALVGHQGGDLEKMYARLSAEYEASERQAGEVRSRITRVDEVAQSLFAEWQKEIGQYSNQDYRRDSERELAATRARTDALVRAMRKAAKAMDPVLVKLHDQVLYLKHNLNARTLGSLSGTARSLEVDVDGLIQQMQGSIAEAEGFIREMKAGQKQQP
jgi:Skp family chaperone for outer membrane proteins